MFAILQLFLSGRKSTGLKKYDHASALPLGLTRID